MSDERGICTHCQGELPLKDLGFDPEVLDNICLRCANKSSHPVIPAVSWYHTNKGYTK